MGKLVTLINLGSFQNTNSRPYPALWNSIIITMKWGLDICISTKLLRWFWCTAWIESHWSEAPDPRPNGSNNSDGHSSWWTPDLWYSLWNSPNGHPFYTHSSSQGYRWTKRIDSFSQMRKVRDRERKCLLRSHSESATAMGLAPSGCLAPLDSKHFCRSHGFDIWVTQRSAHTLGTSH